MTICSDCQNVNETPSKRAYFGPVYDVFENRSVLKGLKCRFFTLKYLVVSMISSVLLISDF